MAFNLAKKGSLFLCPPGPWPGRAAPSREQEVSVFGVGQQGACAVAAALLGRVLAPTSEYRPLLRESPATLSHE